MREAHELPFHRIFAILLRVYHFQSARDAGRNWNPGVVFGLLLMTIIFLMPPFIAARVLEGSLEPEAMAGVVSVGLVLLARLNAEYRRVLIQGSRNPFGLLAGELWTLLPVSPARLYAASALADYLGFLPSSFGHLALLAELIRQLGLPGWLYPPVIVVWLLSAWAYACFEGALQVVVVEKVSARTRRVFHHFRLGVAMALAATLLHVVPGNEQVGASSIGLIQDHAHWLLLHPLGWAPAVVAVAAGSPTHALILAIVAAVVSLGLVVGSTQLAEELGGPETTARVHEENEKGSGAPRSSLLPHPFDRLWSWRPHGLIGWITHIGFTLAVYVGLDSLVRGTNLRDPSDLLFLSCMLVQTGCLTISSGWWCLGPGMESLRLLPVSAGSAMGHLITALAARGILVVLPGALAVAASWNLATRHQMVLGSAILVVCAFLASALGAAAYGVYIDPARRPQELGTADMVGSMGIPLILIPLSTGLYAGGIPAVQSAWVILLTILVLWPAARDSWNGLLDLEQINSTRMRSVIALGILALGIAAPFFGIIGHEMMKGNLHRFEWIQTTILALSSVVFGALSWYYRRRLPRPEPAIPSLAARIALGVAAAVTSLTCAAGFAWLLFRLDVTGPALESPLQKVLEDVLPSGTGLVMFLLFATVIAPLGEELFFRGILYPGLSASWGRPRTAAVVASVTFALFHPPVAFPFLFAFALLLTWLAVRTRSLVSSITAHAIHNGVLMSLFLLHLKNPAVPEPVKVPAETTAAPVDRPPVVSPGTWRARVPWDRLGRALAEDGSHNPAAICFGTARLVDQDPEASRRAEGIACYFTGSTERIASFLASGPPERRGGPFERLLALGSEVLAASGFVVGVGTRLDELITENLAHAPADHGLVLVVFDIARRARLYGLLPSLSAFHGPGWWSCPHMRWDELITESCLVPSLLRAKLELMAWHSSDQSHEVRSLALAVAVLERRLDEADRLAGLLLAPAASSEPAWHAGEVPPRSPRRQCRATGAAEPPLPDPDPGILWSIVGMRLLADGNASAALAAFDGGLAHAHPEAARLASWLRSEKDPFRRPNLLQVPGFLQNAFRLTTGASAAWAAIARGKPDESMRIAGNLRFLSDTVMHHTHHKDWFSLMAAEWIARRRTGDPVPARGFSELNLSRPFDMAATFSYVGCTYLACRVVDVVTRSVTDITELSRLAAPDRAIVQEALDRAETRGLASARELLERFSHREAHSTRLQALEILLAVLDGDFRSAQLRISRDTRILHHSWAAWSLVRMLVAHRVPVPESLIEKAAVADPEHPLPRAFGDSRVMEVTKDLSGLLRRVRLTEAREQLEGQAFKASASMPPIFSTPDDPTPAPSPPPVEPPTGALADRIQAWRELISNPLFTGESLRSTDTVRSILDCLEAGESDLARSLWRLGKSARPSGEVVAHLVQVTADHGHPDLAAAMLAESAIGRNVQGGEGWFVEELRKLAEPFERRDAGTAGGGEAALHAILVALLTFITCAWLVRRLEDLA